MAQNRVEVPGFGVLPAAGVYAAVERSGPVGVGVRPGRLTVLQLSHPVERVGFPQCTGGLRTAVTDAQRSRDVR
jgi:hypothetical protein